MPGDNPFAKKDKESADKAASPDKPASADKGKDKGGMPIEEAMRVAAEGDKMAAELGVDTSMPSEGAAPDLAPLIEMIGMTEEEAKAAYEAAQQIPQTKGKTPDELAQMLAEDVDLMGEIMRLSGQSSDNAAMKAREGEMPDMGDMSGEGGAMATGNMAGRMGNVEDIPDEELWGEEPQETKE